MASRRQAARLPHQILVVDDNDDVRESFVMLLMMHGYRATGASSGFGALRLLRDGLRPSVIVLDLRMPGMDGWAVWEHMSSDPALATIPVVVVSGDVHECQRPAAALVAPDPAVLDVPDGIASPREVARQPAHHRL